MSAPIDYGHLAAAFETWQAERTPTATPVATPTPVSVPLPPTPPPQASGSMPAPRNDYEKLSLAWAEATDQGTTFSPRDVKILVDGLYTYMHDEITEMKRVLDSELERLQKRLQKRKDENEHLRKEIETQAKLIEEGHAQNAILSKKLAQAEVAFQHAEKAYRDLQAAVAAGTIGGGLSQSYFPTMKEPDTFNGEKGSKLDDWLESMALWLRHRNVVSDEKKIETAITYLCGFAKKAMQGYFDKVSDSQPLGLYLTFVKDLKKGF